MEMNRVLFCTMLLLVLSGCQLARGPAAARQETTGARQSNISNPEFSATTISLSEKTYDFGQVEAGKVYRHRFVITNAGMENLHIYTVKGCCDNVTFNQVREAVPAGESCVIEVVFTPRRGQEGKFKKATSVHANTNPEHFILEIAGEVVN